MASPIRLSGRAVASLLPSVRELPGPLYSALAGALITLVQDGRIPLETQLPSERELATSLGMSRASVTAAYDQLRTDGFLASRTGAGSFVRVPSSGLPTRRRGTVIIEPRVIGGGFSTVAADLADEQADIDLTCAAVPGDSAVLAEALADAMRTLPGITSTIGYQPTGLPALRQAVADRFTARGAPTDPEQIMITSGALHAFDLILRLLMNPGDRVLTELPTYSGALDAIRAHGGRLLTVPLPFPESALRDGPRRGAHRALGWDVELMTQSLSRGSARLAFLVPDFHNPTGRLVPQQQRRDVLRAARGAGTTVVIDESCVELGFIPAEGPTAALDPTIITTGSLTKVVWGGIRVGWIRASRDLIQRLSAVRAAMDIAGSVLDQLAAVSLVGRIDALAAARIAELIPQRDALLQAVHLRMPQWRVVAPLGGLSAWVELDRPLATPLTALAGQFGVHVVSGSRFGTENTLERFIRIPFALPADQLVDAVDRLATAWRLLAHAEGRGTPLVIG